MAHHQPTHCHCEARGPSGHPNHAALADDGMTEERLAEIGERLDDGRHIICDGEDDVIELVAEVRRLRGLIGDLQGNWWISSTSHRSTGGAI